MTIKLNFIKGKAVVKKNGKTIAKVYNRKEFFKGTKYANSFQKYPYSLEMSFGMAECENLTKVKTLIAKYI
jgi:hypothetical protein